jgi:uracil-DNA glycosylase
MFMDESKTLISMLDFHLATGAYGVLDEEPHNCFAEEQEHQQQKQQRSLFADDKPNPAAPSLELKSSRSVVTVLPEEAIRSARSLAAASQNLEDLEKNMAAFEGCSLRSTARQLVFADGNPSARLMLVGEGPGADEDRIGKPFVGRAGQLLDKMLAAIGLGRDDVYIANVVPWRPPGNRTPTAHELAVCRPFIERQIELVAPDILLCLGGPACQSLLHIKDGILKSRGRWFDYQAGNRTIPALATLHPAYLLRQPLQKKLAWQDCLALKRALTTKTMAS